MQLPVRKIFTSLFYVVSSVGLVLLTLYLLSSPNQAYAAPKKHSTEAKPINVGFNVGDDVLVRWKKHWWKAKVLQKGSVEDSYYITYDGRDDRWNEWVPFNKVRSLCAALDKKSLGKRRPKLVPIDY